MCKSIGSLFISPKGDPDGRYTCPIVLKRFGLVCDDHLSNAGEILFGNIRPVTLKAGIFATDEKLTFLDMKEFEDITVPENMQRIRFPKP